MNSIYERLDHIRQHSDLEPRIKFKILDVLDLRKSGWVTRSTGPTGPKTIQEIHDDVFFPYFLELIVGCKSKS
jgi:translation initiation factor 4G